MAKTQPRKESLRGPGVGTAALAAALLLAVAGPAHAQTIQPPYNGSYTFTDLGSITNVPTNYGGLTFKLDNSNVILIGGAANGTAGALYSVPVTRGTGNHITALGSASLFGQGANNDGGVVFGPGNVLFLARYPVDELGENKPPSWTTTDKVVSLGSLGVAVSPGALNFVPAGFPGAGLMKIVSWSGGQWYTAAFSSDGTGGFNITSATQNTTIGGGPEGFIYVPLGSPLFTLPSILVSEYSAGSIATYTADSNGDPVVASRAVFMSGLSGAEGAAIDPLTGDFLFSTFGGGNHVIVVQGFAQPPTPTSTPAGVATNTPTATPTLTPTATPTNTPAPSTSTPTSTRTSTPGVAAVVPTLSFPMLGLLGLMLAAAAVFLMRR